MAADFSILQFKNVQTLLLWHGRLSYKRSALLASFIIHRGFIVSVIQLIFSCIFFFVSIPVFNSYLSLGYATFFTFWPVFSLILDTDIDVQFFTNIEIKCHEISKIIRFLTVKQYTFNSEFYRLDLESCIPRQHHNDLNFSDFLVIKLPSSLDHRLYNFNSD